MVREQSQDKEVWRSCVKLRHCRTMVVFSLASRHPGAGHKGPGSDRGDRYMDDSSVRLPERLVGGLWYGSRLHIQQQSVVDMDAQLNI